jgi:hypothetical protein
VGDTSALAYLASRGFSPEAAVTSRLGVVRRPLPGHEQYAGRLALVYTTPAGVVNLRFRCLKAHDCALEGCPKYLSIEGAGTNLYGVLDLKKDSPYLCLTEGEIDRDTLSVLCGMPAVGAPGVDSWQKHWGRCLEDYERVYSFADPDKAGRKFAGFLAREVRAVPITIPGGMDVNSFYCKEGPDGLRQLIGPES